MTTIAIMAIVLTMMIPSQLRNRLWLHSFVEGLFASALIVFLTGYIPGF
jgi:hypothetical protein